MLNIVLIGFMGTGKSVIGRRLAVRMNRVFIDTDNEIEELTGKSVSEIFARYGAVRFRSEEALLVKKLAVKENLVISTGGGMVLNPENVRLLQKKGLLICLKASPEVIYQRVKNKRKRPLLLKGDLKEKILSLINEREGLYDVADFTVDTGTCSVNEAVELILHYLSERNVLDDHGAG